MLLRQVELALLLKIRTSVVLTQGLELVPVLGELLLEAALRRVRKDEFAVAVVLGACELRLRVCAFVCSSAAACTDGGAGCAAAA